MVTHDQHFRVVQDPVLLERGIYLIAEAIFKTALAEARGQTSHWVGANLTDSEIEAIEAEAKEFIADWREHFKRRVRVYREGKSYVPSGDDCRFSRKRS